MLQERRKLMLVWEEDIDFDALELTAAEAESGSVNKASARGNKHEYSPLNEAPGSGDKGESEEEEGFDFLWERVWGLDTNFDREALTHGPINNDEIEKSYF